MTSRTGLRAMAALAAAWIACLLVSAAQAQAPIGVSPRSVKAGTSPTLTVTSNGFFDLSQILPSQISLSPPEGVSNVRISNASPQRLSLTFDLAANAAGGDRRLNIEALDVMVSVRLFVERDPAVCVPACSAPSVCENGTCTRPPGPLACTPTCRPPAECVNGRCMRPAPPPVCRRPARCNEFGQCEIPQ